MEYNLKTVREKFRENGIFYTDRKLMVLLWAVEENAPSGISTALRNWLELLPEERWWLYTITNAASGGMKDVGHGWRAALRYALCENPVDDRQYHQLELMQEGRG